MSTPGRLRSSCTGTPRWQRCRCAGGAQGTGVWGLVTTCAGSSAAGPPRKPGLCQPGPPPPPRRSLGCRTPSGGRSCARGCGSGVPPGRRLAAGWRNRVAPRDSKATVNCPRGLTRRFRPLPCPPAPPRSEGSPRVGGEELREWCRGRISSYKIPRYWKLVQGFPTTTSGKPQVGAGELLLRGAAARPCKARRARQERGRSARPGAAGLPACLPVPHAPTYGCPGHAPPLAQKFKMREAAVAELGLADAAAAVVRQQA